MTMVVGLDIDDTITRNPQFFSFLSKALISAGHVVLIITFREEQNSTETLLHKLNIAYTKLIMSSLDQHREHGVDEWKAWVCREHGVEIFFDDSPDILKFVDSKVLSFMAVDHSRYDLNSLLPQDEK